jgi:hypothetical protein
VCVRVAVPALRVTLVRARVVRVRLQPAAVAGSILARQGGIEPGSVAVIKRGEVRLARTHAGPRLSPGIVDDVLRPVATLAGVDRRRA